jgi:hypothetical protein
MDSDEEWIENTPLTNRYLIQPRTPLRSPLYPGTKNRNEICIKDSPLTALEYWHNIKNYLWNRKTKRLCARDSLEWIQIGCYYFSFFFILGVLSCALVIVYILLLDKKTPRRFGNDSAMALDGGIHPGKFI